MTQEFFGLMALSLSLLACCYAVYFTVWAGGLVPKMPGVKMFGIVATALAVFALVFSSYCLAQAVFMQRQILKMMANQQTHTKAMKHHKSKKSDMKTETNDSNPE